MTERKKPGPSGPGSPGVPPSSLATHAGPLPNQMTSGFRHLNVTPPSPTVPEARECGGAPDCFDPDVRGSRVASEADQALHRATEHVDGLIQAVSWVGDHGMRVTVNFVLAQDPSPQRRWVRRMLGDVLRSSEPEGFAGLDADGGIGAGVRVPVKRPPAGSAAAVALPLPDPVTEAELALVAV